MRHLRRDQNDSAAFMEMLRQQQPDNFDALYNLGMALSDMGALDTAEPHLRHALRVTPGEVRAMIRDYFASTQGIAGQKYQ